MDVNTSKADSSLLRIDLRSILYNLRTRIVSIDCKCQRKTTDAVATIYVGYIENFIEGAKSIVNYPYISRYT